MEAKDTVRYLPNEYRECADEDGAIQKYKVPIHEPSFGAGIKEVVEWLEKNSDKGYIYEGEYTYNTKCDNQIFTDLGDWRAKLKEWGIE